MAVGQRNENQGVLTVNEIIPGPSRLRVRLGVVCSDYKWMCKDYNQEMSGLSAKR